MARKKKVTKISLKEFKAWLQGADDFHGKDWVPTPEQWKMIREKIDSIDEVASPQAVSDHVTAQRPPAPQAAPQPPVQQGLPPGIPPPPPVSGGVPDGAVVGGPPPGAPAPSGASSLDLPPPAPAAAPAGGPAAPVQVPDGSSPSGTRIKTPNIDTRDGNYNSGFA